jgi:hypothetical protein
LEEKGQLSKINQQKSTPELQKGLLVEVEILPEITSDLLCLFIAKYFRSLNLVVENKLHNNLAPALRTHLITIAAMSTSIGVTTMSPKKSKKNINSRWTRRVEAEQHYFKEINLP